MSEESRESLPSGEILRMTSDVVSAYLHNNLLPTSELTVVIQTVHGSLASINNGVNAKPEPQKPAVSIRRSITPEHIVCLEDGKKLKMLKRHLRTTYDMTPQEYRAKWGLPTDYPMVTPNYAKQRSAFAKKIGLGRSNKRRSKQL